MTSDSFTNVEVVESRTEHHYKPMCLTRGKGYSNKRLFAINEI